MKHSSIGMQNLIISGIIAPGKAIRESITFVLQWKEM